ncbi:MAG: glycosyl hydrolase family 18 protein [Alistipes sp.]|nr:glycosyl hydrolase family 18 protein [Alistipes sp.]
MKLLKKILLFVILAVVPGLVRATGTGKVVVAYVTSWSNVMPDPSDMTHINYAFGHVNETFDGLRIDNEPRLREIVSSVKQSDSRPKVILSIGGWGSGRFSEMADDAGRRASFASDCARAVVEYGLDGIDIDWEYPGSSAANISSSDRDTENFTLLMRDIRKVIGPDRLLTIATAANAEYIDFKAILPYIDFVNIMAYDMADAPKHHAGLYPSENTPELTCDGAVKAHLAAGVPAGKLVMGLPFYGRGGARMRGCDFGKITIPEGCEVRFDSIAMVPYIVNPEGELVLGFDNEISIVAKCNYILDNDLLGAMYWDYGGDDTARTLSRTVASLVKEKPNKPKVLVLNEGGGQHGPFTSVAMKWLRDYATGHGFAVTELRNADPISEIFLDNYALVIQLDFPPYTWPKAAEKAFSSYIDEGKGGWIGFHHATLLGEFDGYGLWKWFSDFMGGITFKNYIAPLADGTVTVEKPTHPVMAGVPATFTLRDDEWYTYDMSPRINVNVLAHVDEDSYTPVSDIRMGDHPVVWTNPSKKARNIYIQPGHSPLLFESEAFVRLFSNAINWTLDSRIKTD